MRLRSVRVEGTVRIEPSAKPGRTLQRFRGVCAVTMPAPLGPAMEKMIVAQIARSYARLPAIVDDWVQARCVLSQFAMRMDALNQRR